MLLLFFPLFCYGQSSKLHLFSLSDLTEQSLKINISNVIYFKHLSFYLVRTNATVMLLM